MAIQGLQQTTAFDSPSGRRPGNFREAILRLYPNGGGIQKAPITALTAVMKSESTNDPKYSWFTKQMQDRRVKLGGSLGTTNSNVSENITLESGATGLKAGDLLYVENTGEIMRVATDPASDTVVYVTRGFTVTGAVAQTAVIYNGGTTNPYLKVIGSAFPEGSTAPSPISFDPVELSNQTQIFRGTYGMTRTAQKTKTRTGPELAESKREGLEIFTMDMEMGLVFGKKSTKTGGNGNILRTTDGLLAQIPSDRIYTPASGIIDVNWLDAISENIFRYGSTEKMAFCGSTFLTNIAKMVRLSGAGQYQLGEKVKEYGMGGIQRLTTPNGDLVLKVHPLFSQMQGSTVDQVYTSWANNAMILDMANIRYKYLVDSDVQHQTDLQVPGLDGTLNGFIAECGLEVHHPYTHALIAGVKGASAPA